MLRSTRVNKWTKNKFLIKTYQPINNHFAPLQAGIEVLSLSKRIMKEVMCLAEDQGIPIYYQDTDRLHLPSSRVSKFDLHFQKKYGRVLSGDDLGQFNTDFKMEGHINVKDMLCEYSLGKMLSGYSRRLQREDRDCSHSHGSRSDKVCQIESRMDYLCNSWGQPALRIFVV